MNLLRNRLTSKLFIFIFIVSFLLIGGSYTLFYFVGKNFLQNSVNKELAIYHNLFHNSFISLLNQYNSELDAFILENRARINSDTCNQKWIQEFMQNSYKQYEELYLAQNDKKNIILFLPEKVFSGEYYLNKRNIDSVNFSKILSKIKFIEEDLSITKYGISFNSTSTDVYISKQLELNSLLFKINMLFFFETLFNDIQLPSEMHISIVDLNNTITYSTNKIWNNQSLGIYINPKILTSTYSKIDSEEIMAGKWESNFLNCNIIITKNFSYEYDQFNSIFNNLLMYSGIVYLLIILSAILYSNKLSKSLTEITSVIKLVSTGNFNNYINIKRNDELGLLITAFNSMIIELKSSYEKLNHTNKELEDKINELVKTKAELTKKEKLALVGETISKISHEIQNKVSGVSVWIQNLEMQLDLNENTKIYVTEIKNALNSFLKMLLDFKKFYGKPYLEKDHFPLNDMISRIIYNYEIDLKSKEIIIKNNLNNFDCMLYADKNLIEEVIINLFVNAIYFSPANGNISIEAKIKENVFNFSIYNKGPKIDSEKIENIFNPFFTTKSSGSGLGLAICKNIIEAHDGNIKVKNLKNGVEFIFTLPNKREE